nr:hypothetical protein [Tanacetum cinerariifolium]
LKEDVEWACHRKGLGSGVLKEDVEWACHRKGLGSGHMGKGLGNATVRVRCRRKFCGEDIQCYLFGGKLG